MEFIKIEATKKSPLVELDASAKMRIRGRSIMENPNSFYKEIIEWVSQCKSDSLLVEIQLEYLNTSSAKAFLNLLKTIKCHYYTKTLIINWYYLIEDEEMYELGKDFELLTNIPFKFFQLSESNSYFEKKNPEPIKIDSGN